jgi:thiol-disulfide isomerase/thioredoxin
MLSINLGPLAFPWPPLQLLGAFVLTLWLARRLAAPPERAGVESALWWALAAGLLAARGIHVLRHLDAYGPQPLSMLDVRDGGWDAVSGFIAGAVWLMARGSAQPRWRRAIGVAALSGGLLWAVAGELAWHADGGTEGPPDLALVELPGGRRVMWSELRDGRPIVINLWASWCGPCRAEMPVLAAGQQREPGVRFLFVNQGEPAPVVQAYLQREGLPLQDVWLDPASAFGPAVGSRGLPTTLFLDAQGRRVSSHFGALNAASLQVALQALRARTDNGGF